MKININNILIVLLLCLIPTIFFCKKNKFTKKFEFPKLTGSYGIGTTSRHIFDQKRKEPNNPKEQRELMVYIWYPAKNSDKNPLINYYKEEIETVKNRFKKNGFPEEYIKSIDTVYSHAVPNAIPLHKKTAYPVVLFSHGYLGTEPSMYTAFCEELASQGYIVISIAHTYYATVVRFPDGRKISPSKEKYSQQSSPSKEEQDLWIADAQCVLDNLANYNADSSNMFFNLLDMNRIGIVGHSMGGSAAFRLCLQDDRVKTGISLDSLPFGDNIKINDLKKPFMFILAQDTIDNFYLSDEEFAKKVEMDVESAKKVRKNLETMDRQMKENYEALKQSKTISAVTIPDINHGGFSDFLILKDLPLYKNNKQIIDLELITGAADGFKTISFINKQIATFLDKHLKMGSSK